MYDLMKLGGPSGVVAWRVDTFSNWRELVVRRVAGGDLVHTAMVIDEGLGRWRPVQPDESGWSFVYRNPEQEGGSTPIPDWMLQHWCIHSALEWFPVHREYEDNVMLEVLQEYLPTGGWIPYDLEERKAMFPKAFSELARFASHSMGPVD